MNYNLFGTFAILTGIISFFPIIIRIWNTQNTFNFTWSNIFLALLSNIMWILYGVSSNSATNIASGSIFFLFYSYITYVKMK